MLHPVSRTFHGRDVFAPAAAHLAAGMPLAELGPALDPADLVRRVDARPQARRHRCSTAAVQYVDRFGNIQLAVSPVGARRAVRARRAWPRSWTGDDRYYARCAETFADVDAGEIVLYKDSAGLLSVAINRGNAAELTAVSVGDRMGVELAPGRRRTNRLICRSKVLVNSDQRKRPSRSGSTVPEAASCA